MSQLSRYLRDRILEKICSKLDLFERESIKKRKQEGKLLFLSELIPYFKGTKVFMFGTGGSVDNLNDVARLKNYNLMTVSSGPIYMYRKYGFIPNLWYLHYGPTAQVVLEKEKKTLLDFSETFILVPANDSQSAVHFSSPIVKEFRRRHPEATYVLYREIREPYRRSYSAPETYLSECIEPLRMLFGGTLTSVFLPLCGYFSISTLYFSGVDNLPTGHFWDRNRFYQATDGTQLDFPNKELTLKFAAIAQAICKRKNIKVCRLEVEETIFKNFPYLNFDKALAEASPKITPKHIEQSVKVN